MSGHRELRDVYPRTRDGDANGNCANTNADSDGRSERLLPVRGQHVRRTERWRVSYQLQLGAPGGLSERGALRHLYANTNGDRFSNRECQ